jgi:tRNA A-37 threonylcarbamoyl transferase component Bud32
MDSTSAGATLICPRDEAPTTTSRETGSGLATHLVTQAAVRLRILAYLYAFTFFMAAFLPVLFSAADRALLVSRPTLWAPGVIGITVALLVAAVTKSPRVSLKAAMVIGLMFEVVSSYGIATAEFLDSEAFNMSGHAWMGLSWVAVWTLLFTVVVPTSPRKAVPAALASVSAVPVTIGYVMATRPTTFHPSPMQFFFWLIFPYLLVVVMAYVGARVVYALGKEVTRSRELGSYRLVERLGQGGMGEVWRAQHRMLARPAAIKLIRPAATGNGNAVASTEMRRRFEREAQATASLRSPHTVSLFDFGVSDDGTFYYVMELLEGLTAEALVQRYGQLPFRRAIYVLRQMCHSLSEADARGLVHRDIKPANIFLCRYGEEFDFVKVLDFGLVTALNEQPDGSMTLTREHAIHGTPAFIAPEQALGLAKLDGRADIYATGCVAYWLLTGQLVFKAETPLELILHHAHTVPAPPSDRTELPIPPALDQLVLECLAKNPADRPQSAKELSQRLGEIAGPDAWTEAQAREWWAIHEPSLVPPSGRPRAATPRP